MPNIIYLLCLALSLMNIILSLLYFVKVKSIWRYIKLAYAASNAYLFILLIQSYFDPAAARQQMFLGLAVILAAMSSGLLVSFVKVNFANNLDKKLKGDI